MSSKAAKRNDAYKNRAEKRQKEQNRKKAIGRAMSLPEMAAALGIRLE